MKKIAFFNNSFSLCLFKRVAFDVMQFLLILIKGIGRFHNRLVIPKTKKHFSDPVIIFKCIFTFFYDEFLSVLILKGEDIKLNPWPNKNSYLYLSYCHWNVNSLATDNYSKVVALKTYNFICKYDFITY